MAVKNAPKQIKLNFSSKSDIFIPLFLDYEYRGKRHNLLEDFNTRTIICYGGAGSGKSIFMMQRIIYKCLKIPNRSVLALRKLNNTVYPSIWKGFLGILEQWGLMGFVQINKTRFEILFPNGSTIQMTGLDNEDAIRSIYGISDIWLEEATDFSQDEFQQLNLRLRDLKKGFNQMHLSFNPVSKLSFCYKLFFEQEPPQDCIVCLSTFKDNPFLPQAFVDEVEDMKRTNPTKYRIYAEGAWVTEGKQVFTNYEVGEFDEYKLLKDGLVPTFGLDFGYSAHPSAFVASLVDMQNKKIYVYDEMYGYGMNNEDIARWLKLNQYHKAIITADHNEPKSITHLRNLGITRIRKARKGKDSIRTGISFLNMFDTIIHPRCVNFLEEIENYTYKKNKYTGEYTNEIERDQKDHALDSWRYSVEEFVPKGKVRSINKGMLGL